MAPDAPRVFAPAISSAADLGFWRAAFGDGETSCALVENEGVGGGGTWFVATGTCFKLGRGNGWFSWSALQTSKTATIAPVGGNSCHSGPLNSRNRRALMGAVPSD